MIVLYLAGLVIAVVIVVDIAAFIVEAGPRANAIADVTPSIRQIALCACCAPSTLYRRGKDQWPVYSALPCRTFGWKLEGHMSTTLVEEFLDEPFHLRLAVTGALDQSGSEMLFSRFADALLADVRFVVVDVDRVETLDQDGLKALVSLRAYASAAGVAYEVAHAPPLLQHVLGLTSLQGSELDG